MNGATYASTLMKITASGQISIPADVRRRWQTDRVIVIANHQVILDGPKAQVLQKLQTPPPSTVPTSTVPMSPRPN